MRNVEEFKGNTTDKLWAMMGNVVNAQGVERHGQSCFLYVYPNGTPETKAAFMENDWLDSDVLVEDETPSGPIELVAANLLDTFVQCNNFTDDPTALEYDGYRVGAGWIYGALLVAKAHGCTQAVVHISSNDGNLGMEAWDRKLGAYVTAVHITYYGT
jgi:hypothetical protein